MITTTILLAAILTRQPQIEPAHAQNIVFKEVLEKGLESGGQKVTLPRPRLSDGQDAAVPGRRSPLARRLQYRPRSTAARLGLFAPYHEGP